MDFKRLKQLVDDTEMPPECTSFFQGYGQKVKLVKISFAVFTGVLALFGLWFFIVRISSTTVHRPFTPILFVFVVSIAVYFILLRRANESVRERAFLPLLCHFLPGFTLLREAVSLRTWEKADNFQLFSGDEVHSQEGGSGDFANFLSYQNQSFHMHLQFIIVSRTTKSKKVDTYYEHTLFSGKLGHFVSQTPFLSSSSIQPNYMNSMLEKMKFIDDMKQYEDTLRSSIKQASKQDIIYTLPPFVAGTSLETFIYEYTKYFNQPLHIVMIENELFIYENKMVAWTKPNETEKISLEEVVKRDVLRVLSYVAIAEELIKINSADQ